MSDKVIENNKTRDSCPFLTWRRLDQKLGISTMNHCERGLKVTEIKPGVVQGWNYFLKWSRERSSCTPCLFSHSSLEKRGEQRTVFLGLASFLDAVMQMYAFL